MDFNLKYGIIVIGLTDFRIVSETTKNFAAFYNKERQASNSNLK